MHKHVQICGKTRRIRHRPESSRCVLLLAGKHPCASAHATNACFNPHHHCRAFSSLFCPSNLGIILPCFSSSLPFVTQIRGHTAGTLPTPPTAGLFFVFNAGRVQHFFPSTIVELCAHTLVDPLCSQFLQIINTSYQKLPFGSGDDPDKLFFHQALN